LEGTGGRDGRDQSAHDGDREASTGRRHGATVYAPDVAERSEGTISNRADPLADRLEGHTSRREVWP
jgi:hypothetical protein